MTQKANDYLALPTIRMDYAEGTFINMLTGERAAEVSGIVLAYREDRVLWPTLSEKDRRPLCVNGSEFGPCLCGFADWGPSGEAPDCAEEVSVLLWLNTQLATLTARRSHIKVLTQYIEMQNVLGQPLHAQRVTLGMCPGENGLHRLVLMPENYLNRAEQEKMLALAVKVGGKFGEVL